MNKQIYSVIIVDYDLFEIAAIFDNEQAAKDCLSDIHNNPENRWFSYRKISYIQEYPIYTSYTPEILK